MRSPRKGRLTERWVSTRITLSVPGHRPISVQVAVPEDLDQAIAALLEDQGVVDPQVRIQSRALRNTSLNVGGGNDQVSLLGGVRDSDVLLGDGDDRLRLHGAIDESTVLAGAGDDVVLISGRGDLTGFVSGGEGIDRLAFTNRSSGVDVRLERDWQLDLPTRALDGFEIDADDWQDALEHVLTIDGFELVLGSDGSDVLSASSSDLLLQAGDGDDWLLINMAPQYDPLGLDNLLVHGGTGLDTYLFHGWNDPTDLSGRGPVHLDVSVLELLEGKDRLATANQRGDVSLLAISPAGLESPLGTQLLKIDSIENLLSGISDSDNGTFAIATSLGEGGTLVMLADQLPARYAPVATFRYDQADLVVWNA